MEWRVKSGFGKWIKKDQNLKALSYFQMFSFYFFLVFFMCIKFMAHIKQKDNFLKNTLSVEE